MTKEELEKEARTECFMLTVNTIGIDQRDVELAYIMGAEPREKRIEELEKENAELRKDKKELCHSISEGGKACVYLNEQLTKATKIIKKLYAVYYAPCVTESDLKYRDELFAEIKKFLSEVEK